MTDSDSVEAWRAQRYAALRRDTGWLTLSGLDWLKPGINVVGTDAAADVVLRTGPARAGTITVLETDVRASGQFTHAAEPVDDLRLINDQQGEPTILELGPFACASSSAGAAWPYAPGIWSRPGAATSPGSTTGRWTRRGS